MSGSVQVSQSPTGGDYASFCFYHLRFQDLCIHWLRMGLSVPARRLTAGGEWRAQNNGRSSLLRRRGSLAVPPLLPMDPSDDSR